VPILSPKGDLLGIMDVEAHQANFFSDKACPALLSLFVTELCAMGLCRSWLKSTRSAPSWVKSSREHACLACAVAVSFRRL
jgi:hypothetical protein